MTTKRIRDDGHLSKQEYETLQGAQPDFPPSSYLKASSTTLATRRTVTAKHCSGKRQEFARHIHALNSSFVSWFKSEISKDDTTDISDGAQDYVDFVTQLEDRYLRRHGEVLTFGSGDCGQLAHGIDDDDDLTVRFPRVVYSLRDKKVCGIACGGLHNAVFTEEGHVYTWGCGDDGSLGRLGDENTPLLVEALQHDVVNALACGDGQTIAVTVDGNVWGWGCFKDKEGKKFSNPPFDASNPQPWKSIKAQQNLPVQIPELRNIVDVACGASFCVARSATGSAYSWGLGESGELGRPVKPLKDSSGEYDTKQIYHDHIKPGFMYFAPEGTTRGSAAPQAVENVKAIGCGSYHTMVVAVGGRVYSCGLNQYAQLGIGNTDSPKELLVEALPLRQLGVSSVRGGVHHSLVLTSSGELRAFGRSDYGQMGIALDSNDAAGSFSEKAVRPQLSLAGGAKVVQIECGGNHNLALTSSNEVYTWGYGDMSALGHGDDKDEPIPKKINFNKAQIGRDAIRVTQVAGGGQHSAIIGEILSTAK